MKTDMPEGLSIIIPAYNEGGAIAQTLSDLSQILPTIGRPTEVIVVDDGSTDNTVQQAQAKGVRVIQHPINSGYGRSLLTGIESATYNTISIIDADGTYPVDKLPDLLIVFDKGFDMVVGARQGKNYYTSFGKRILRFLFRFLAEYTCGRSIPDINSGFRIFDRKPVLAWRASISTGFSFTTTITLLFMMNNLFVGYTPITYSKRVGNSKVRLVTDSLRSLQIIFTTIAQFNPLKLYLLVLVIDMVGMLSLGGLMLNTSCISVSAAWVMAITWNTLCLLMGLSILTVATIKPAPSLIR